MLWIFYSLNAWIDFRRLCSDVNRRQTLTSKVGPRVGKVNTIRYHYNRLCALLLLYYHMRLNSAGTSYYMKYNRSFGLSMTPSSSSIQLSATGRLPGYHVYVLWVQNPPLPWPTPAGQTIWSECDLHTNSQKTGDVLMIIHVARTPSFFYRPHTHLLSRSDW